MRNFKETGQILIDSFFEYKNTYFSSKHALTFGIKKREEKIATSFDILLTQFQAAKFPVNKSVLYKIFNFIESHSQTLLGEHLMKDCFKIFECSLPKPKAINPPIQFLTMRLGTIAFHRFELRRYAQQVWDNNLQYKIKIRSTFQRLINNFDTELSVGLYSMFRLSIHHNLPLEVSAIVNSYACDIFSK